MMNDKNLEMVELKDDELECVAGGRRDEQTNIIVTILRAFGVDC